MSEKCGDLGERRGDLGEYSEMNGRTVLQRRSAFAAFRAVRESNRLDRVFKRFVDYSRCWAGAETWIPAPQE